MKRQTNFQLMITVNLEHKIATVREIFVSSPLALNPGLCFTQLTFIVDGDRLVCFIVSVVFHVGNFVFFIEFAIYLVLHISDSIVVLACA